MTPFHPKQGKWRKISITPNYQTPPSTLQLGTRECITMPIIL